MPNTYKLAHLSDLHCPIPLSIPMWKLLNKRMTGRYNWLRKRSKIHNLEALNNTLSNIHEQSPNHILCSGDLTNLGTQQEQLLMIEWLNKLGNAQDISLVAGNHDAYVVGDGKRASKLWQNWIKGDCQNDDFPFVKEIPLSENQKIVIFKVNSAIATRPFSAQGRVGRNQRARLEILLQSYDSQNCFKIIMLHHPPLQGLTPKSRSLKDDKAFTELIKHHSPHLVVYGHNHTHQLTMMKTQSHEIPIIGVRSASEISGHPHADGAGFNLYTLSYVHLKSGPKSWRLKAEFYATQENSALAAQFTPPQEWMF